MERKYDYDYDYDNNLTDYQNKNTIKKLLTEINDIFTDIDYILDTTYHQPYQDLNDFQKLNFGECLDKYRDKENDKDSKYINRNPISDFLENEWKVSLNKVKRENRELLEKLFIKNKNPTYHRGYLNGFRSCCQLMEIYGKILEAPIIKHSFYGVYKGNGKFSESHKEPYLYPNSFEKQLHLNHLSDNFKRGNFNLSS